MKLPSIIKRRTITTACNPYPYAYTIPLCQPGRRTQIGLNNIFIMLKIQEYMCMHVAIYIDKIQLDFTREE